MKISSIQLIKPFYRLLPSFLFLFLIGSFQKINAQSGEELFNQRCAQCHQFHVDGTGPKLYEARKRWEKDGEGELIIEWVQNNAKLRASGKSKRANKIFAEWKGSVMNTFADLSSEQVVSILDYVDSQEPGAGGAGNANVAQNDVSASNEESGTGWIWYIMAVIFVTIILSVGGVRRQLKLMTSENPDDEKSTYTEEFKAWAWKNRKYVGIGSIVVILSVLVSLYNVLGNINVMEGYQPSQPIAFPHSVHAGINGIDCKYCHNSVTKSKSAGIPSVNVCMNCHKHISGQGKPFEDEIKKIYAASGWNPESKSYKDSVKPIVWNKVHVLPDHVYFNHSQHVVAGNIDCKQCHGDMANLQATAKVHPVSELNEIEGNIKLSKPTLTMGWCIECHGKKEIALGDGSNAYYQEIHERLKKEAGQRTYKRFLNDNKGVSVAELGGWECAKCHY
jgi:mono/diheme cytochrome c family protein